MDTEEALRKQAFQRIKRGERFYDVRSSMIAAGKDKHVVDRVIAEVLRAQTEGTLPHDPFMSDKHASAHKEKNKATVRRVRRVAIRIWFERLVLFCIVVSISAYATWFMFFQEEKEAVCDGNAKTTLTCAELYLDRYYRAHQRFPETLAPLVPQYAQGPLISEKTGAPLLYEITENGTGYRICVEAGTPEEFCSIRQASKPFLQETQ